MHIASFKHIVANGNRDTHGPVMEPSRVWCNDGFSLSIIAGRGTCSTRGEDGFTTVEVGFPTERPEPWALWSLRAEDTFDPTETVYAHIPVGMVEDLIRLHGGEA